MQKLKLLLNTLSMLSLNQIFFLGSNKIIKSKLKPILVVLNKKFNRLNNFIAFKTISEKLNNVIGSDSIWRAGIEQSQNHYQYYNELKANIIDYTNTGDICVIANYWNTAADDVEVNYNYQRFYLFKEVFDELDIHDDIKIRLMKEWITKSNNLHLAWTGFNCAIRLMNWLKIINEIKSENMPEDSWSIIQQSMYLQHRFNLSNIEHHIPGNHVLYQYYSAWLVTEIFSDWKTKIDSKRSLQKLLSEIAVEFLDSGLHFELSTHYHLQISLVGLYLIGHLQNLNREVPGRLISTMNKAAAVIDNFLIGNYYPLIGDGCYNFLHEKYDEDLQNFYDLRDKYLSAENGDTITNYDNQYILMKDKNFHIIFDVGEIGLKQNPGHGHADLLSIVLGYNKIPIFIDPGTFQYNIKEESLNLKRTSYHNTVAINGKDQAKLWGFFRWAFLPKDILSKYNINDDGTMYFEGEFVGYRHLGGIKHKRFIKIEDDSVIIKDVLNGTLGKSIQINFVLHPAISVEKQDNSIILSTGIYKFELSSNTKNIIPTVQDIMIYVSYNEPTSSNKIIFEKKKIVADEFRSEVILKPIS
ncbi:MAG: alginate lyase family protein [Ignavibacteriaceae bacterium]